MSPIILEKNFKNTCSVRNYRYVYNKLCVDVLLSVIKKNNNPVIEESRNLEVIYLRRVLLFR